MKRFKQVIPILLLGWAVLPASLHPADHLRISELVLQPSKGEYVVITNPTTAAVDMSNYYITDATDPATAKYYYNLPSGADYWSGFSTDFIARFPAGKMLGSGDSYLVSLTTNAYYLETYGTLPDLSLKDSLLSVPSDGATLGAAPYGKVDNIAESLILFYWDGSSATVKDVDYLVWGDTTYAIDKSGVSGYQNDTPAASQSLMPVHVDGQKLIRVSDEGTETASGGNGITGHDETSENLATTWMVTDQTSVKPEIGSVTVSPASPTTDDSLTFSVTASDATALTSVTLYTVLAGDTSDVLMTSSDGAHFSKKTAPADSVGTLVYWAVAKNSAGLQAKSSVGGVTIQLPPEILTIKDVRDNFAYYSGKVVTLTGVVTIGNGLLRIDRLSGYFQDASGRGMNIYSASLFAELVRGVEIQVTGTVLDYNGVIELELIGAPIILNAHAEVPAAQSIPVEYIKAHPAEYEGTLLRIQGRVTGRADNIGGGSNITLDDGTEATTLRIWNSTNILVDASGDLINTRLDSVLQIGNKVDVVSVGGLYSGTAQLLAAYDEDINYWTDVTGVGEKIHLEVAPYPFIPALGEKIKIVYEYPSDSRVILRVYSLNGQYVTTLFDDYQGMAYTKTTYWNGRDELGKLIAPGTYIMHLELTSRSNGNRQTAIAPVVVAGKWND